MTERNGDATAATAGAGVAAAGLLLDTALRPRLRSFCNRYKAAVVRIAKRRSTRPLSTAPGLTSDQEAWLVAVTHDNTTFPWPPLSDNQMLQLQHSVQTYQQITEIPNYPYHQAGEAGTPVA